MSTTGTIERVVRLPYPHPGQQLVRQQAKRFNWLAAGRRWRKTTLFVALAVEKLLDGQRGIYGAPTYDQVSIAFDEMKHAAGGVFHFNQSKMRVTAPNGATAIFRSLDDPDNARGHSADWVMIDEAADVKAEAWYEVLRPMLMETEGEAWGGGTHNGRTWFATEQQKAKDRSDSMAWQAPTRGCQITEAGLIHVPHPLENPHIKFSEIEEMYLHLPESVFRQEVLAEINEGAGEVFRNVRSRTKAERQPTGIAGHRYLLAVDWGKSRDFTVVGIGDLTLKHLVSMDRFNKIDYAFQLERIKAHVERFTVDGRAPRVIAESNSMGGPLVETLARDGIKVIPFNTTNASKNEAVEALAIAFERRNSPLQIIDDERLLYELEIYKAKRLPSGLMSYSAPENEHDDCVQMLMMLWEEMKESGRRLNFEGFDESERAETRQYAPQEIPRSSYIIGPGGRSAPGGGNGITRIAHDLRPKRRG